MLGLVAHGLHLLLVVLGLAGVAALLLPQRWGARSPGDPALRPAAFHPPATPGEHDARVAELRSALTDGGLGRPAPGHLRGGDLPAASRAVEGDSATWRAVAAVSSLAAALVHAAVFPHHLEEGVVVGWFFFVVAVGQAGWAYGLSRRVTPARLVAGIVANLALVGLWAASRTTGLPLGPGREPVGAWDVAAVTWQLCLVAACVVGLGTSRDNRLPLGRPRPATWAWALLSVALLVVLTLTVSHG